MSIMDILTTLGNSFVSQRTATLFVLTLPAIGICERYGLKEKAIDFIRSIKSATANTLNRYKAPDESLRIKTKPADLSRSG